MQILLVLATLIYIESKITSKAPKISQYYITIRYLLYNSQIKCID